METARKDSAGPMRSPFTCSNHRESTRPFTPYQDVREQGVTTSCQGLCAPNSSHGGGWGGLWASSLGSLVASKLAVSVYSLASLHIPWGGSWNPQCRAKCKGGTWAKLLFAPMGRANLLFESLCSANRISLEATLSCGHPATWPPSSPVHTSSHQPPAQPHGWGSQADNDTAPPLFVHSLILRKCVFLYSLLYILLKGNGRKRGINSTTRGCDSPPPAPAPACQRHGTDYS